MEYVYNPRGVCSIKMIFNIDADIIKSLSIIGGCPGNTVGVSKLVEGKKIDEVIALLKGINCYVNMIPYNETSHIDFKKSDKETIMKFYDTLKKNNVNVTVRKEFGSKVSAACGQLRSNYEEGK